MMIDRSIDEADIVHALGYPEYEHQIFAYRQWVKDNQTLFDTNTPMEVYIMVQPCHPLWFKVAT